MQPPLISSFSLVVLKEVRKYSSTALLGFLMHEWQDDWRDICQQLNCSLVDVNQVILNLARVEDIKKTNRLLYTFDNLNTAV